MPLAALQFSTEAALAVAASYLLGSVPFGLMLGFLRGVDIRKVGSGNIGATSVGRALGRPAALLAFFCDLGKGWAPVYAVMHWGGGDMTLAVLCGGAAVCGHVWPLYLRFHGGKGVATGCGALVAIDPILFVGGGVVWLVTVAISRYVGLASLLMGASFPILAWWRMKSEPFGFEVVWGAGALTLLVFLRHRENIQRMLAGTESKIGGRKQAVATNATEEQD